MPRRALPRSPRRDLRGQIRRRHPLRVPPAPHGRRLRLAACVGRHSRVQLPRPPARARAPRRHQATRVDAGHRRRPRFRGVLFHLHEQGAPDCFFFSNASVCSSRASVSHTAARARYAPSHRKWQASSTSPPATARRGSGGGASPITIPSPIPPPCPTSSLTPLTPRPSPTVSSQFGLATLILTLASPLLGAVSFKAVGLLQASLLPLPRTAAAAAACRVGCPILSSSGVQRRRQLSRVCAAPLPGQMSVSLSLP